MTTIRLSDRLELRPYEAPVAGTTTTRLYCDGGHVANIYAPHADALIAACNPPRYGLPPGVIHGSDGKFYAPGDVARSLPDDMWETLNYNGLSAAGAYDHLVYQVRPTAANQVQPLPDHTFRLPDGRLACLRRDAAALRAQGATLTTTDVGYEVDATYDDRCPDQVLVVEFPPAPKTEPIDTRLAKGRKIADGRVVLCTGDSDLGPWFRCYGESEGTFVPTVEVLCLEGEQ